MKIVTTHISRKKSIILSTFFLLFALPASTTYELHDAGFGSGGVGVAESGTYGMTGISGEVSGAQGVGTLYNLGPGLQFTRQSNVPAAPTFSNPANYYGKLQFIIDTGGNPTDTLFVIAISSDDFVTTNFIQANGTVGASAVYQTYADWGGGTGEFVVGLTASTTYKIKVAAVQTKYTETEYSVATAASTTAPSLSFDIDVSSTNSETAAPYAVAFGSLAVGSVTTATDKIWFDLESNAEGGSFVYVYGSGTGLYSTAAVHTIPSVTANLAVTSEGYGMRIDGVTQSAGGPLAAVSPYAGTLENVGVINTTTQTILNSSAQPITAGRASFVLKAITSTMTPAATDYSETITAVASATF